MIVKIIYDVLHVIRGKENVEASKGYYWELSGSIKYNTYLVIYCKNLILNEENFQQTIRSRKCNDVMLLNPFSFFKVCVAVMKEKFWESKLLRIQWKKLLIYMFKRAVSFNFNFVSSVMHVSVIKYLKDKREEKFSLSWPFW